VYFTTPYKYLSSIYCGNETHYEYDNANRRTAMIDALNHRTEYTYDDYDRLVHTTFADGSFRTTEYDKAGRKTAEVDQEGKRTEFAYDSCGNLINVTDAMGHITRYTYDENNNRITQPDAINHTTTMSYDNLNRMVLRTYPNGDHEHFGFDAIGNQLFKADGEGDSAVFSYDKRNREIMRRYTNSGHTVETHYTSDSKPDTVVDYRGNTVYSYNNRGRQESVTNPDGTYIRSHYDNQGNRTTQVTPFDSVTYGYDSLNRMVEVASRNGGGANYFYDAVGNRDSVLNANGTSVGYQYDNLNRLTNLTNYAPDRSVISSYSYELNDAGIRTAVVEADGSRVDYSYDNGYKLTGETRTGTHQYAISYTYDPVGNRLTQIRGGIITNYTYNNRDQLESESSTNRNVSYTYDRAGKLTSKIGIAGTTNYSWIDDDRLENVAGPSGIINYTYDNQSMRVSMDNGTEIKKYLVDKQFTYGQVIAEYDENGSLTCGYVYGLERISQDRNSSPHFYIADGQGSIRNLTDTAGNITDVYYYNAFGEELAKSGSTENEFRYVGEQWDPNAGFYYLRARWMDPGTGKFVSVDSYEGDPQTPISLHRYLYCGVDPVNQSDPAGANFLGEMYSMSINGILRAQSYLLYGWYRALLALTAIRGLTSNNLQHILNEHHMLTRAQQIPYILSRAGTQAAEAFVRQKTYFNPSWSESQVQAAVMTALRLAAQAGVRSGIYVTKVGKETITIAFDKSGQMQSAWGSHILTLKDFIY
jgi:RHS repeat-associated protein